MRQPYSPRKRRGDSNKAPNALETGSQPNEGNSAQSLAGKFRQGLSPRQTKVCISAIALLVALILFLLIFAAACAPSPAASSSLLPVASIPSSVADDSFDKDAFSKVMTEFTGVLLEEGSDAGATYVQETLFLGDSNTARMVTSSVGEVDMKNAIGIESMGVTSVLGLKCVRFSGMSDTAMPQAAAIMQPKRIVVNFGTNNAGMNTESFINSYRKAVEGIQKSWPYADIFIASVFPISQGCTYGGIKMSYIEDFNISLLTLAKEMDVSFLNWSDALKDTATGYCQSKYMTGDGVHLSDAGINAIFKYFRTHSYEGEDTRPHPLKTIPKRLPTPEGLFPKPASSSQAPASSSSSSASSVPTTLTVPNYNNPGAWPVTYVTVANDGSYAKGELVGDQTPVAGTQVAAVCTITVYVADEQSVVEVPPVESSVDLPVESSVDIPVDPPADPPLAAEEPAV